MRIDVKEVVMALLLGGVLLAGEVSTALAQDVASSSSTEVQNTDKPTTSPLTSLGNEYQNSITLLQNRFRVDYNVDEITMIFFREYGSSPIVLVRPDGSKLFQGRFDEEKVAWFDSDTFDMISIKNPVPGPWQAIGQVLPKSRVMVISDLELHTEPLPTVLFSGEIIKSTAHLTNGGAPIDNGLFRDVVDLKIDFISTNNPNFDNFGADDQQIAVFEDNGRGMDERPKDGIFTGQFNLSVTQGEWQPIFSVKTPMFTREQVADPIVLYANPVTVEVEMDNGNGYHTLLIDVDREQVNIDSLLIDGKMQFPNGDTQNFSLTEGGANIREYQVVAFEQGIFRVKLTAYGTTIDGRDFILDVPEFNFLAEAPEPEIEDPLIEGEDPIVDGSEDPLAKRESQDQMLVEPVDDEESMDSNKLLMLILVVNGSIVVIGVLVAGAVIITRKSKKPPTEKKKPVGKKKSISDTELLLDNEPKGFQKLLSKFKKSK